MSSQDQRRETDWTRTLRGFDRLGESASPAAAAEKPPLVHVGARVSPTGQLFETEGGPGSGRLVVKLFPWAAGVAR